MIKKFEFCSALRFFRPEWTPLQNDSFFGKKSQIHGFNFLSYFQFSGEIQENTGMILELSQLKSLILDQVISAYDHHFLNTDTLPFCTGMTQPSLQQISKSLYEKSVKATLPLGITTESVSLQTLHGHSEVFSTREGEVKTYLIKLDSVLIRSLRESKLYEGYSSLTLSCRLPLQEDPVLNGFALEQHLYAKLQAFSDSISKNSLWGSRIYSLEELAYLWWDLLRQIAAFSSIKLSLENGFECEFLNGKILRSTCCFYVPLAHRLLKSENLEESQLCFGECARLHGHNFLIKVTSQTSSGIELYQSLEPFFSNLSYSTLNDIPDFQAFLPTCELFILWLHSKLNDLASLHAIYLEETSNNHFLLEVD